MDYLEKQVYQGKQAASFIAQEAWVNAVAKVKERYHAEFAGSKAHEAPLRESAYNRIGALADIELELKKIIDGGLHAENEVQRSAKKKS